jgi:hypothetical protein
MSSDLRSYLFESLRKYARSRVRTSEMPEPSDSVGASERGLYWYSNRSKCRWNTIVDVDKVMKDVSKVSLLSGQAQVMMDHGAK